MKKKLKIFIDKCKNILSKKFRQDNPKVTYISIAVILFIIFVFSIHVFLELTENLKDKYMTNIDASVSQYIISFRTPTLTKYFTFVTKVGGPYGYAAVLIICLVVFYLIFKNWKYIIELTLVLLLSSVSNIILKQISNRARPSIAHLVTVKTLSYPSGHAMTAMAFYGFLIYLVYKFKLKPFLKGSIITFFILLIFSIGLSRIYLGVHYPSDILGGFIAGFIWVVFGIIILNVILVFKEDPNM